MTTASKFTGALSLALLVVAVTGSNARADLMIGVPFVISETGVGFGTAPPVLTIQGNPAESGSVSWNGAMDFESNTDPTTGQSYGGVDAGKSGTVTAAQILSTGSSNFGVVFNVNDAGNPKQLDLENLTVTLYNANGSPVTNGSASIDAGVLEEGGGQGGDGHFFPLIFTGSTFNDFFGNGLNRLGMSATITSSEAGAESFRVASSVPEPGALWLVGLTGALAMIRTWINRQRNSVN